MVRDTDEQEASEMSTILDATKSVAVRRPTWPKSAVRVTFGIVWLIDAILKWLPGFRKDYLPALTEGAAGQPGWLRPWFDFWIRLQRPAPTFFAYLVAVVETLIALALIFGFARKVTYISAAAFSFLIWATAEGFGGPYTSGSADIGTAIVYALVFLALLAMSAQFGTSRYSVDALLERRISWWHRVAEVEPRPRVTAEDPAVVTPVGSKAA
jgi:nitrite reductase (NO-forming)